MQGTWHTYLRGLAASIGASEAIAFRVAGLPGSPDPTLDVFVHIRPDAPAESTRRHAIDLFQKFLQPCVVRQTDGVVELPAMTPTVADERPQPQFCLCALHPKPTAPSVATAFIIRGNDIAEAKEKLQTLRSQLDAPPPSI